MHVLPLSRVFGRHSSSLPTAAALDEEGLKIGAALAWISHHGNLDDFPSSRNERLALMTTAVRRGFAAWDRGHDRYRLTKLGKIQAACYPSNIKWKAPAHDAPAAKRGLGVRLLEGFESRPYSMIAAFFAVGVAVGAAASWAPSSSPGDTQSALSASSQTSDDSKAPAASDDLPAPGSPVAAPQDPPKTANAPAPPAAAPVPASPAREPVAPQRTQASDPTPRTSARQEERAPTAAISGSVAATRAIGHFDRGPSADLTEPPASTKLPDSQAVPAPKSVGETPLKPASRHRSRDARTQHAGADRAPTWSQDADDGDRPMLAPHTGRGPDLAEQPVRHGPARYRRYRNFPSSDGDREPSSDPMGLVGWLFR
jgi:hypothetical protein